jgi:hypothetical protein
MQLAIVMITSTVMIRGMQLATVMIADTVNISDATGYSYDNRHSEYQRCNWHSCDNRHSGVQRDATGYSYDNRHSDDQSDATGIAMRTDIVNISDATGKL